MALSLHKKASYTQSEVKGQRIGCARIMNMSQSLHRRRGEAIVRSPSASAKLTSLSLKVVRPTQDKMIKEMTKTYQNSATLKIPIKS